MNTTFKTNIRLLISTLRTASYRIVDDTVRKVEKAAIQRSDIKSDNSDVQRSNKQ